MAGVESVALPAVLGAPVVSAEWLAVLGAPVASGAPLAADGGLGGLPGALVSTDASLVVRRELDASPAVLAGPVALGAPQVAAVWLGAPLAPVGRPVPVG